MLIHGNLFHPLPDASDGEVFEDLIRHPSVRIERIVSRGQTSPESGWYDQKEHEWVIVLKGMAELTFEPDEVLTLGVGEYVHIPAHRKHRVSWTDPAGETVWLAVFCPELAEHYGT